jgi:hypothetical protein
VKFWWKPFLRLRVQIQDTAKSMNRKGVLQLVQLIYCYGHGCCPLLLKSISTNTKKLWMVQNLFFMMNWGTHFRMTPTLPLSLKTSMLRGSAKKYWHSPCSVYHIMQTSEIQTGGLAFLTHFILVHTESRKQKTNIFLLSFRKISILLLNTHQTQRSFQITTQLSNADWKWAQNAPQGHQS